MYLPWGRRPAPGWGTSSTSHHSSASDTPPCSQQQKTPRSPKQTTVDLFFVLQANYLHQIPAQERQRSNLAGFKDLGDH